MRLVSFTTLLTFTALVSTAPFTRADDTPPSVPGWVMTRDGPGIPFGQSDDYQIGIDTQVAHTGKASAFIKAVKAKPDSFRAWTQQVKADAYRGKRVRLTGYVKTQEVTFAGLWMRVDGIHGEQFGFDNMGDRPLAGTTDWQPYSVVLDVPKGAALINFGSMLDGTGEVWIDDLTLEAVNPATVAATRPSLASSKDSQRETLPSRAANLDFEAVAADATTVPSWYSKPKSDYEQGRDTIEKHGGNASAFLKSVAEKPTGFRGWSQAIKADAYRGKRVRLTGYLKSDKVVGWTDLWMRVDGSNAEIFGFDNMLDGKTDRSIHGTTDWQPYSIVLDVPRQSTAIFFGSMLNGTGEVWIDDFTLETVDPATVASTSMDLEQMNAGQKAWRKQLASLPTHPINLNFEK